MKNLRRELTFKITGAEAILLAVIILQLVIVLLLVHECRMWQEKAGTIRGIAEKALIIPHSPYNLHPAEEPAK